MISSRNQSRQAREVVVNTVYLDVVYESIYSGYVIGYKSPYVECSAPQDLRQGFDGGAEEQS